MRLRRREFIKGAIALATAGPLAEPPVLARKGKNVTLIVRYDISKNGKMVPAPADSLKHIYLMDPDYNPLMAKLDLTGEDGVLTFSEPDRPYKIASAGWVDGFGWIYLVADNGGDGYRPGELGPEVDLNLEIARSRVKAIEQAMSAAESASVVFSSGLNERLKKAHSYLDVLAPDSASAWKALNEALWAGEMLALERAKHAISRRGPRPGFKFGANAFVCLDQGEDYARHFYSLLNYATLPFYYRGFEAVKGRPSWQRLDRMVEWCERGKITPKGHPLLWVHEAGVPTWLEDKSFDNFETVHRRRIKRIVGRYAGRIDYWDVINEAHDAANVLDFTYEQLLDLTRMSCATTRAANSSATVIVNSTAVWGQYAAPKPGDPLPARRKRTPHQYVADCIRERFDFDVIGLQVYFPSRDIFEIDRMLNRFGKFGKPIHITEHAVASDPSEDPDSGIRTPSGQWHAPFSQTIQADFLEQFWTIAYSKDFVTAITYWDFADKGRHFWPHGGFLDENLKPKEVYHRLKKLLDSWK